MTNPNEKEIVESKNRIIDALIEKGFIADSDSESEDIGDLLLDELHRLLEKVKR